MVPPSLLLCSLVLVGGAPVVSESARSVPAADLPEPGGDAIEGIVLGESFDAVNARLGLRNIVPVVEGQDAKVYRWPAPIQADTPDDAQRLRALEIVFENEVVVAIRSSYRSRVRYSRMGPDLIARYGEPAVVRAGPPRQLPVEPHGIAKEPEADPSEPIYRVPEVRPAKPRYLWVEQWVWKWEESTLEVIGEHYTEDPQRVADGLHIFRFRLTSRSYGE